MNNKDNFKYIDTKYLYNISKNNDFLKKIFSLFKEEVKTFKKDLPELAESKKYDALAELVHKAKSSTAIVGMHEQSQNMKLLEKDIRNAENIESFNKRIVDFLDACDKAVAEIKQLEQEF
ncbi:MAG: Hpt domain-containing protein [Chlorobi bacterium]|nr:Hpt domain-containing protein [Chlorobiota bacterium]